MKKLALIFSLAALTLMGLSCAKKDNNQVTYQMNAYGQCVDSNGNYVGSNYCGYQYVNGQCMQVANGAYQVAPMQYCQSSGNGMYSCIQAQTGQPVQNQLCLTGGYGYTCIQTTTRQPVQNQLCQTSIYGGGFGGIVQQQCYGPYMYPANGQIYQCGIQVNCSGATMISQQTGQQVQCL